MSGVVTTFWCHLCKISFNSESLECKQCGYDLVEDLDNNPQNFSLDLSSLQVIENSYLDSEFFSKILRYMSGGTLIDKKIVTCNESCSICYENMTQAIELNCNHKFHDHCLAPWLECHSTCPLCRDSL
jgi:hypothetical protein